MSVPFPYLSVVLPCRNQADHIGPVLARYADALSTVPGGYELIVVPNASTDNTAEVVADLGRADPRVRVVPIPLGGWGRAVKAGLTAARGTVLCYTNSARTDPATIADLLKLYESSAPCLAKVRRIKRGAPAREVGSWLYNLEARLLFGVRAPDVNGTPKIFSRELYDGLNLASDGDLIDLELLAKAKRLGASVVELPVEGFRRHGGKSTTTVRSAWGMYAGALRMRAALAAFPKAGS